MTNQTTRHHETSFIEPSGGLITEQLLYKPRQEFAHILDTFDILRDREQEEFGNIEERKSVFRNMKWLMSGDPVD